MLKLLFLLSLVTLTLTCVQQNRTIQQQRALIKAMMQVPTCMGVPATMPKVKIPNPITRKT